MSLNFFLTIPHRHREPPVGGVAIQPQNWIVTSLTLLAMTTRGGDFFKVSYDS